MKPDEPRVKVCGISRAEDAQLAAALGAAAIGFIFWPGSRRFVAPAIAAGIAAQLPEGVARIGVFVDQTPAEIGAVAAVAGLTVIQLHGAESAADYAVLGLPIVKAIPVPDAFDPAVVEEVPADVTVLLDAHDPIRRGGTGRTVDWTAAAAVAGRRQTILSGGLTADNVAEAIARVRPYMIDVSSGVESSPGVKDAARLRAFFAAVGAARQRQRQEQSGLK